MKILTFPNNKLTRVSLDYDLDDKIQREELVSSIKKMADTMYGSNGIGLAAPQVGINKRMFIIDVEQNVEKDKDGEVISVKPGRLLVFINPKIIDKQGEIRYEEGCLSVPGVYEEVVRAKNITVEFYDENFQKKQISTDGLLAIAIQHENDHLDGMLFIDRLPPVKRTIVKKRILKGKNL
jgi:peptide deformylase